MGERWSDPLVSQVSMWRRHLVFNPETSVCCVFNSVSTPSFNALETENDSEVSLSKSKEEEFPSSSRPFRRETRATRRAMQNRESRRKNGETVVLPNVPFTPNCKSQLISAVSFIFYRKRKRDRVLDRGGGWRRWWIFWEVELSKTSTVEQTQKQERPTHSELWEKKAR